MNPWPAAPPAAGARRHLSFALLLGLVANAAVGLWWADPAAALLMVPWLVKEGVAGVRGEEEGSGADD